ncbi:conserved hypothetical protein [Streptococcus salivarius 57.I]|nr:conserved hypothetical protein [Streptococcus salivarius 57.I]
MEAVFLFYKDESRRAYIQEHTKKPFQSEWLNNKMLLI